MGEGCRTFFRVVLGILTVLFLLIGILMLAFGVALKVKPMEVLSTVTTAFTDVFKDQSGAADLKAVLQSATDGLAIFMIVLGCVTIAISILGLAGTITGSKAILAVYATLMILILGAEIALIVIVAAVPQKIQGAMNTILPLNYASQDVTFLNGTSATPPRDLNGLFWYLIQNYFACCGFTSNDDYVHVINNKPTVLNSSAYYPEITLKYPSSCCTKKILKQAVFNSTDQLKDFGQCRIGTLDSVNTYGCAQKFFDGSSTIPIAVAAATLGLEVLLIISAIVVAALKRNKSYV